MLAERITGLFTSLIQARDPRVNFHSRAVCQSAQRYDQLINVPDRCRNSRRDSNAGKKRMIDGVNENSDPK
jgi:hypothetical protein